MEDGRFIDVNDEFLRVLGYERNEIIGKKSVDLQLYRDIRQRDVIKNIVKEQGCIKNFELLYQTKHGELKHGLFSGDVIHLQNQTCWLTILHDITQLKLAQEQLKSEEKYRTLFETMVQGVVYQAANGEIISALKELALNTEKMFNLSCIFNYDNDIVIHDNSIEIDLYRIAQEAINNVIKHARANHIYINLIKVNDKIVLKIKDDGIGISKVTDNVKGMGLKVMEFRANMIGAEFDIYKDKEEGTAAECIIKE